MGTMPAVRRMTSAQPDRCSPRYSLVGVHGKDGKYPTDGHLLGEEVPIGQGKVNYPVFVERLKEVGYDGDITIEREISGEEQKKDILAGKEYLEQLIG